MTAEQKRVLVALRDAETRVAKVVCSGGVLTKAEADRRDYLRQITGWQFDAVNQKFTRYVA